MNRFAASFTGRAARGRLARAGAMAVMLGLGAGPVAGILAAPAMAQSNPYAPVAWVNGKVVTTWEVDQRLRFLTALRQPGDLQKEARQGLIDDRLRVWAATQVGLKLNPDQVKQGMEEFASRANLSAEQFTAELAKNGIASETFRDFVAASIAWRELIRAKYLPTVKISDAEIDRAIAMAVSKPEVRVLLAELIIPIDGDPADELALAERLQSEAQGEAAFAAAAREYSAAPTAERGGKLDWMVLSNLPPAIASQVIGLKPGQITAPMTLPNAVAILQLRAISDAGNVETREQTLDYAQFLVPDGPEAAAELAGIHAKVDGCNDLFKVAKGLPADRMLRATEPLARIPRDIALELAKLDAGESSTALRRGGWRVFLMLCSRTPTTEKAPDREQIRQQLIGQRLGSLAEIYLEELRSEAIVKTQ